MKFIVQVLIGLSLLFSQLSGSAAACTLAIDIRTKFTPAEYVFLAEVQGYAGPIKSKSILRDAWGLKVSVDYGFNLPKKPGENLEVYPLGMTNACDLTGTSLESMKKYYPIGSKVRVVAQEFVDDSAKSSDGSVRLVTGEYNQGLLARNDIGDGFDSSIGSVYDYRRDQMQTRAALDKGAVFYYYSILGDFELRKDLIRLRDAQTQTSKLAILKRLSHYSGYMIGDRQNGFYEEAVKNHLQNKRLINQLLKD